jgi:peptide/nickel transport system substrate-binding protein
MWFCPAIQTREVVERYGDLSDWRNAVGTGPFILTDYVSGSSATYIRNENYRGYDQRYPEDKLPYVDGVKLLIIPDNATVMTTWRRLLLPTS